MLLPGSFSKEKKVSELKAQGHKVAMIGDGNIEKVKLTYADLALRKFITELNSSEVNPNRAPQVDVTNLVNGTSTTATYNHPKDPVEVRENDIVTSFLPASAPT